MKTDSDKTNRTLGDVLRSRNISRRSFLKFCAATASMMALPPSMIPAIAQALEKARRPSVIWLSFQECTGCTESFTRSFSPTIENLIFNAISLDYHETLMAASGQAAEAARLAAMKENWGKYLLIVEGSIPTGNAGYSTIAGMSNLDTFIQTAAGAAAIISVGTCASFGGIPNAKPNPTAAYSVYEIAKKYGNSEPDSFTSATLNKTGTGSLAGKPIINVPGCPPIPAVMTGVLAQFLTFGKVPELDQLGRPLAFYGQSIHDRCYRRPFYDKGMFAETFDDEGAKKGWCLYKLGCKGPITHNACATTKWNNGTSFPIESGHPCLGCSEPDFWDGGGFYNSISTSTLNLNTPTAYALAAGAAAGLAVGITSRVKKNKAVKSHQKVTVNDLAKDDTK